MTPTSKSTAEATAGAAEVAELPRVDEAIVIVERLYQAITGSPPLAAPDEPYTPIPVEKDAAEFVTERLDRLIDAIDAIGAIGPIGQPFAAGSPASGQDPRSQRGPRARPAQAGAPSARAAAETTWSPPLTLWEDGDGLLIHLEVPGVQRDDLQLLDEGDSLTVAGKRASEDGGKRLRTTERPLGPFWRRIILPRGTGGGEVKARLHDGVLEVRIPRPKGGAAVVAQFDCPSSAGHSRNWSRGGVH
jgi:HSP20 family molecular chaperone IbpA